jgi:hypothetical protein
LFSASVDFFGQLTDFLGRTDYLGRAYGATLYHWRKAITAGGISAPLCLVHVGNLRQSSNSNGIARHGIIPGHIKVL